MNESNKLFINERIINNMTEGVITLSMNGRITSANPAAEKILCLPENAVGSTFASLFFDDERNDGFTQSILDAVYQNTVMHNHVVEYWSGDIQRQLFISTSYLRNGDECMGVTAVFSDITEIAELRDAVKAMEKIKLMNVELEKRNEFIKKTFGRYLSDDIVKTILETRDGLEIGGKKQSVTIMFSDIRGFTFLSEQMEPRALINMLNAYLEKMTEIILNRKGTILEFIGDAIVAVFGAPLESDTSDFDAVSAAIEMQLKMADVNADNIRNGYPEMEMGIGIHSGEVVLGNIGSMKKTKYDIIGKNVNLASRIETYTVGGQIYISPVTAKSLGEALGTGQELEIMPKGVKEPITIYEVKSLGGLHMPSDVKEFKKLDPAIAVVISPLDGKHSGDVHFDALITELSEKEAVLTASASLNVSQNIVFKQNGEDVYAKVISVDSGRFVIHITAGKIQPVNA